jgi:hypothetical protein
VLLHLSLYPFAFFHLLPFLFSHSSFAACFLFFSVSCLGARCVSEIVLCFHSEFHKPFRFFEWQFVFCVPFEETKKVTSSTWKIGAVWNVKVIMRTRALVRWAATSLVMWLERLSIGCPIKNETSHRGKETELNE